MSESSIRPDEEHNRKRRTLNTGQSSFPIDDGGQNSSPTVELTRDQYTVGWICALPVELIAAKAILDVEHVLPKTTADYHNVYTLGSIHNHNVVIACLPDGSYGTTSAAVVAERMMHDFKSIDISLLVGIGGGVPTSQNDIRLGDVVVSTPTSDHPAVIQYDLGKTGADGVLVRKGTLNNPKALLLQAVAKIKASHRTSQNRVPEYISRALQRLSPNQAEYLYPGAENDDLYQPICDSEQNRCTTSICAGEGLTTRSVRLNSNPYIHCGTIASGNQVIKDAHTRNRIAKDSNALCFEMEAAGVMNEYQYLVIRGICDYCDSHKDKRFQKYAALSAAACAKELLLILPARHLLETQEEAYVDDAILDHRKASMEMLDFEESGTRRATVKKAHKQTCKWLLEQQEYLDWLDEGLFTQHHGLLWIKGKPGTGKSTIMKFVLEEILKTNSDTITVSFFFNARGHDLEKSTAGMYRSLIHQILSSAPKLQALLDGTKLNTTLATQFSTDFLQQLFRSAVESSATKKLMCFVDALDECPEDQIRSMIKFFQEVGELAASKQVSFHVLFSSRHYPNITVDTGRILVLENQKGHSQDIMKYINAELKIGTSKQAGRIKEQIELKSSGIFLWVMLVIRILQSDFDKGRVRDLEKRLKELPEDLDKLFQEIITRDGQRLPELVLCVQWILYAARPLRREELYFALLAGSDRKPVPQWDPDIETVAVMDHMILDTSKGLAETTKSKKPTVHFIHETVREFLLKPGVLIDLCQGFQSMSKTRSHWHLKECCDRYISSETLSAIGLPEKLPNAKSSAAASIREKVQCLFPFLEYAVENTLYHAEQAEYPIFSQARYIQSLLQGPWLRLHNCLQKHDTSRINIENREYDKFMYYLATKKLSKLLLSYLKSVSEVEYRVGKMLRILSNPERFEACISLLKAVGIKASSPEKGNIVTMLQSTENHIAQPPDKVCSSNEDAMLTNGVDWYAKTSPDALNLFFQWAVLAQHEVAVSVACKKGVNLSQKFKSGDTALHIASEAVSEVLLGHGACIDILNDKRHTPFFSADLAKAKLLLTHGAEINIRSKQRDNSPLQDACEQGNISVVKLLLDAGADIHAQGGEYGNALQAAAADAGDSRAVSVVKLLIDNGANINAQGGHYGNALQAAAHSGHKKIVKLLIDAGADVNAQGGEYVTALYAAISSRQREFEVVKLLIDAGADVNAQGGFYGNALQAAARSNTDSVVKLLLDAGADVNAQGGHHGNALQAAARYRGDLMIKLLLDAGADVNAQGGHHGNALQAAACSKTNPVVKLLLDAGADVNAQGGKYGNAMQAAVTKGTKSVVKLLLDAGTVLNTLSISSSGASAKGNLTVTF